eukprot:TRINITY_DN6094_c0_g1_i1.p1 TRINITY_DN6094_c0_g1~~TRINITY_DN6094_c0_g1_i1.p1  ORF type:complete len:661 (-),score=107.95 TRINITY_DN6094_c0_g1_i1:38-2020(-)
MANNLKLYGVSTFAGSRPGDSNSNILQECMFMGPKDICNFELANILFFLDENRLRKIETLEQGYTVSNVRNTHSDIVCIAPIDGATLGYLVDNYIHTLDIKTCAIGDAIYIPESNITSFCMQNGNLAYSTGTCLYFNGEEYPYFTYISHIISHHSILYICDCGKGKIFKLDQNELQLLAGSVNDDNKVKTVSANEAIFNYPTKMCIIEDHMLVVTDTYNNTIRLINLDNGTVNILAGTVEGFRDSNLDNSAQFSFPSGLCYYKENIVVCDTNNNRLRLIQFEIKCVSCNKLHRKWVCENSEESCIICNNNILYKNTKKLACGHPFCKGCFNDISSTKFLNGEIAQTCSECDVEIAYSEYRDLVEKDLLDRIVSSLSVQLIEQFDDSIQCPECDTWSLFDTKEKCGICNNPDCELNFCVCGQEYHPFRSHEPGICSICEEEEYLFVSKLCMEEVACNSCMYDWVKSNITHYTNVIECPSREISHELSYEEIMYILGDDVVLKNLYQNRILESILSSSLKFRWCPTEGCEDGGFLEGECGRCDSCNIVYCASCELEYHSPWTCEEAATLVGLDDTETTLYWMHKYSKKCPACKTYIEKSGGCTHMTCKFCRYEFCWVCGRKYKSGNYGYDDHSCNCRNNPHEDEDIHWINIKETWGLDEYPL